MAPPTEFHGVYDATALITIICAALSLYNAFELVLLIFTTFNAYRGLYFWSILVATVGIFPYSIGMEVMYFAPSHKLPGLIVNNVGWITMVVSQSVVLYSRLGIVLGDMKSRILTFTKWMIIVDAIVLYTLATVVVFGMQFSRDKHFGEIYPYSEKFQMSLFTCQEFFISAVYIYKTLDILGAGEKKQAHRTVRQLFVINLVIVGLDIALLVLEYRNLASTQIAFKALAYSVKLKLEFAILNKLVESSSMAQRNMLIAFEDTLALDTDKDNELPNTSSGGAESKRQSTADNVPPTPRAWDNANGSGGMVSEEHAEHENHSRESLRITSHQTENSEKHLLGMSRSVQSDPYHDMIRFIDR